MQVARAAASCADREFPREISFSAGGKSGTFFMTNMHPVNLVQAPQRVREAVERVADDAVNALHPGLGEGFCHKIRCGSAHGAILGRCRWSMDALFNG